MVPQLIVPAAHLCTTVTQQSPQHLPSAPAFYDLGSTSFPAMDPGHSGRVREQREKSICKRKLKVSNTTPCSSTGVRYNSSKGQIIFTDPSVNYVTLT